jgi:hypothetical protein
VPASTPTIQIRRLCLPHPSAARGCRLGPHTTGGASARVRALQVQMRRPTHARGVSKAGSEMPDSMAGNRWVGVGGVCSTIRREEIGRGRAVGTLSRSL